MFTTGRLVFVAVFLVAFVAMLIYSYKKDAKITRIHFSKSYKILLGMLLFLILQFIIVKLGRFI